MQPASTRIEESNTSFPSLCKPDANATDATGATGPPRVKVLVLLVVSSQERPGEPLHTSPRNDSIC